MALYATGPSATIGLVLGFGAGAALALGAFLDGIPEQLVLGLGLGIPVGGGVSLGLLGAIFVSNLPEAVGSASAMREAGRTRTTILRLWTGVAAGCVLACLAGYAWADNVGGTAVGIVNSFAAGALIVMVVDAMIPEASRLGGARAGLLRTRGFGSPRACRAWASDRLVLRHPDRVMRVHPSPRKAA